MSSRGFVLGGMCPGGKCPSDKCRGIYLLEVSVQEYIPVCVGGGGGGLSCHRPGVL